MNFSSQAFRKSAIAIAFAALNSAAVAAPIDLGILAVPTIPAAPFNPVWSPANGGPASVTYYFQTLVDVGSLSSNFNYTPAGSTGFMGAFYTSNSGGSTLIKLADYVQDGSRNIDLSYGSFAAGYYAVRFDVASVLDDPTFSGQISARPVPAPAVLSLVGIGLLGFGLARKARRV
jgi:hypothetical protein